MSRTLLVQMAASPDPTTRANANIALEAHGLGPNGTPLAAAPAATAPAPTAAPAPTPITPAAKPVASPAPGPSGNQDVPFDKNVHGLGKYSTLEELKRGYFNAVNTLSQVTDENVRLKSQGSGQPAPPTTLPGSAPGDAPRVNPTQRTLDIQKVVAELVKSSEESGQIDPTVLLQTVAQVADQAGRDAVEQVLRPRDAMSEADAYMRSTYPDSVNHGQELGNFVKTDPAVGPAVMALMQTGQFKAAMEYAWQMYTVRNGMVAERKVEANSQIAEEERLRARAAAGFSGSPNTGVHAEVRKANEPLTAADVAQLNEIAKTGPDGETFRRRAMLGAFLPPEWRTWENQNQQG